MTTAAQDNPIAAFTAGRIPLARMFWFHGVVAGFAAGMALGGLGGISPGLQQIWAVLMLVYMLAWYVGLWRSAGQYTGPAIWRWAARGVVVMPVVGILLAVVLGSGTGWRTQQSAPATAAPASHSAFDKDGKPCTEVTEFLGECKRQQWQPAPPNLKPFTGKLDAETQTATSIEAWAGWTQETTGSSEKGPWLRYMPQGSRFCRLADGAIVTVFPPGVRPQAEQANPFCASVSVASPDQL